MFFFYYYVVYVAGIFCVINILNYLDRRAIASNGVNGHRGTCTDYKPIL